MTFELRPSLLGKRVRTLDDGDRRSLRGICNRIRPDGMVEVQLDAPPLTPLIVVRRHPDECEVIE